MTDARGIEVRALAPADLAQAPALLAPEGWDFTLDELERLRRLGGAVGAWEEGRLVAFLTHVDLPPVRWIGNVVVAPEARGRGVGARLVQAALEGAPRAALYAVEKAVSLYERLGFEAAGAAYALRAEEARPLRPSATEPLTRADLLETARLDRQESGMDRGFLLRELLAAYPDTARLARRRGAVAGYGIAKTYAGLTELGPVVAPDPGVAEDLLDALLALSPGPYEATVLAANRRGLSALEARGFVQRFRTVLMHRGGAPAWRPGALAAAAGPEKG